MELEEDRFKREVLVHRPDIYHDLFTPQIEEEPLIHEIVPQTEGDVQAMLAELRQAGAIAEG